MTIQEPIFNSIVFETVQEYEEYIFVKLGYGANFYYEYTITPDVVGEYTLESTRIDFESEQGFAHRAISAPISCGVSTSTQLAASTIPSGIPSSSAQISITSDRFSSLSLKSVCTRLASDSNSLMAMY